MVKSIFSILLSSIVFIAANAQEYTTSSIFAHNDYVHSIPFLSSYDAQVGFIEADIFLKRNDLMVAHTKEEIKPERNLEDLYLKPLLKVIEANNGSVYPRVGKTLTLMIDIKTEGISTLNALVKKLKKYPQLISCHTLQIVISGNVPDPRLWKNYPSYIHFDGRPGIPYSEDQLNRVSLISTNFRNYSQWDGKGVLTKSEREKIVTLIDDVHALGKKIRFWGAPDFSNAWSTMMSLKVDILGTDDVSGLANFLKQQSKNTQEDR